MFHNTEAGEVASLMNISERSVYRYAERFLATGEVRPFLKKNGPSTILGEYEEYYLVCQVLANPGIYLRELQEQLYSATLHWVDLSTILQTLHRANISRQVIKHHAIQRSESCRAQYWSEFRYFGPSMIIWIDESGFDGRNAIRKYGYGIRSLPPRDFHLKLRGKRYSAIGILTTEGIEDVHIVEQSVDGEVFLSFIRKYLLPIIMPFNGVNPKSVVVLDNASIHHVSSVFETITRVGALVRFLPPYSPDMNPIEEVFAEVKQYLKANDSLYQATTSPKQLILGAFLSVSKENCNAYIHHAGYT